MKNDDKLAICSLIGGFAGATAGSMLGFQIAETINGMSDVYYHSLGLFSTFAGIATGGSLGLYAGTFIGELFYKKPEE